MFDQHPLRFMFAFGLSIATTIGFAAAWFRASRRVRELEDRMLEALSPPAKEPVADALDGLVARIDDIANAQDFLGRVLSERLGKLPVARPRHEVTPV